MYATLIGTNTGNTRARALAVRLCKIADEAGFAAPDQQLRARPDGPTEGWNIEMRGPGDGSADFLLSVLEPRVPGMSPIYPYSKTIDGPLFAVIVLQTEFGLSRDDRRDYFEVQSEDAVLREFEDFLRRTTVRV